MAGLHKFEYYDLHFSINDILNNIETEPQVEAIPVSWIYSTGMRKATPSERDAIVKMVNEFQAEYRDKKG